MRMRKAHQMSKVVIPPQIFQYKALTLDRMQHYPSLSLTLQSLLPETSWTQASSVQSSGFGGKPLRLAASRVACQIVIERRESSSSLKLLLMHATLSRSRGITCVNICIPVVEHWWVQKRKRRLPPEVCPVDHQASD